MVNILDNSRRNAHPVLWAVRLAFSLVLVMGLIWGDATWAYKVNSAPNPPPHITSLAQIPIAVHRRAAQHLEEMRGSEMAPGWEYAILEDNVRYLFRPDDQQNPAYYEISVIIVDETGKPTPAGFIILAANENDVPIPHWDFTGDSPTRILDLEAESPIQTYYKLDTLSYVAEDRYGNIIARLGQLPPKIEGMDMAWLDQEQELGESTWIPDTTIPDDQGAGTISGTLIISGTVTPPAELKISGWESWQELKAGYSESYGVFLEQQRREASEFWQGEQADLEHGVVLVKEQIYDMALLWAGPDVTLTGPGVAYITTQVISQGVDLPEFFRVVVASNVPVGLTPFTATVSYDNNVQETVRFQIMEQHHIYLPSVLSSHNGSAAARSLAIAGEARGYTSDTIRANWSSWNVFWAGTHAAQRQYNQISAGSPPNTSGCWSGCGATAWGMLFGWADNQAASGNPYWAGRWGLYRQNGGYGANVVAPQNMDTGVRNMIWEIRGRINTFCAFGSGATAPWNMGQAAGYLINRSGTSLSTHYNVLGIHTGGLRDRARDSIIYRGTPAIIGTGWLTHYPLAYGYRWRSRRRCFIACWTEYDRQFYVNQGWGGNGNGWVSAGTWFAGEIRP